MVVALAGMAWLSRIGPATLYFTGVAMPMAVLAVGGRGVYTAHDRRLAGVASEDAGAARALSTSRSSWEWFTGPLAPRWTAPPRRCRRRRQVRPPPRRRQRAAHAISTSLTAGTVMLKKWRSPSSSLRVRPQRPATVRVRDLPLVDVEEQLAGIIRFEATRRRAGSVVSAMRIVVINHVT